MPVIIDISEALTSYREIASLTKSKKEVEATIKSVVGQAVSEGIETLANLEEHDVEDYCGYLDYHVPLNHPDAEDNLLIELSELVFKSTLNHALHSPTVHDHCCVDSYKLMEDKFLVIDTV